MAFALGLDPAFVGAHHVVRLIVLNLFVPMWLYHAGRQTPVVSRPPSASDEKE
jgi:uncharacterized protein